jgi:NADPH:quinone reductase
VNGVPSAAAGAELTVVTATPERGERPRMFGAHHVVQDLAEAEGPFDIAHFDYTNSDISDGRDLETLVSLVSEDRLHPEIGVVADWGETDSVLQRLRGRAVRGNAVLTLSRA